MVIIQAMEAGQLQWGDHERILAIQRQHSRAATPAPAPVNSTPRRVSSASHAATGGPTPIVCIPFQTNACDRPTDHPSAQGFVHHVCAFCLRVTGRPINSHSEADCRRKKQSDDAKNSQ
jgi:hypothetical protein